MASRGSNESNIGPSSLLPSEPELPYYLHREEPLKQAPSSLLPEPSTDLHARAREEFTAISPSVLLPAAAPRRLPGWINRKTAGAAGALLLLLAVANFLPSRINQKSVPELMQEAAAYIDRGNRTAAVIQLKNALLADPNHVEARLLHGKLILESGEPRVAEEEFRRAQELGAQRETVLPLLAKALIARKEYQEALDVSAPRPGEDPSKQAPAVTAQRGHALLLLGRTQQAREAFESVLAVDTDHADALFGIARVAVIERDRERATISVTRAVERAPDNPDALALLADLTRLAGDDSKAATTYEKAIAIAPGNHAMRLSLVSIYVSLQDYDKAIAHLDHVLKAVPGSPTANYLHATIQFRREKYVEARNLAAKVLSVQGNHVPSLLMVGASAFMTRDYPIAEKALRRALVLLPGHWYARKMLGASLVKIQQPRQALDELLPLVKRFPQDADLFATIGEAYLDLGEYGPASQFLEKATAIAPKDASARIGLGRSRLAAGELERAVEELEAARALAPQGREAKLLLAMTHLRRQEFDKTVAIINELDPKLRMNPIAHNLVGAAHIGKKDFRAAARQFEQALELAPDYMPAVMNLVQIHMRDKDTRAAVRRLETMIKHSPNSIQAMFALAAILADTPDRREEALRWLERAQKANPDSPEPLLQLARYHLAREARDEALDAVRRGLDMPISNPEVLDAFGQVQLSARAHRQALDTYVRMTSDHPKLPLAHYRLGSVQEQTANAAGARQSFKNALALHPDFMEAKVRLAQLEGKAGNTAFALRLAHELQQQLPKSGLGLTLKGDVLALSNRMAEAIPAFESAFAIEKSPALVLKLHQAYAQTGRVERGEKIVDEWLRSNPHDVRTRQFVADYSMSIGRHRVAQGHYGALAAAMPKNQQVLNNLALAYEALKDPRALETADRAHHLDTRNPYVADTYGWMLARLGRPERARDIFKEAIMLAPAIPDLRYHYAVALAESGQRKEARSQLERAFSLKGKLTEENAAKALLEELRN